MTEGKERLSKSEIQENTKNLKLNMYVLHF